MMNRKIYGMLCSVVVGLLALLSGSARGTSWVPVPTTMFGHISSADLIVVARVGQIHRMLSLRGYDVIPAEGPGGIPMVDYELIIDEVLSDDPLMPVPANETTLLRLVQSHDAASLAKAAERLEGTFLMFLARNPDRSGYGITSVGALVRLDENPPRYELEGEEHRLQPETASGTELVALTRQALHDHATGSYTGIWHDVRNNGRFYSVHDNGEQVVLINLPGIEQGQSVLQEAYLGDRAKLVLTRITPNNSPNDLLASVRLLPLSPTEMMVEAMCLGCGVNAIRLKKVF